MDYKDKTILENLAFQQYYKDKVDTLAAKILPRIIYSAGDIDETEVGPDKWKQQVWELCLTHAQKLSSYAPLVQMVAQKCFDQLVTIKKTRPNGTKL